jgi:hypothetical protein
MKHVFTVHSHITYLSSLGIIDSLKIRPDDILIISANYECPTGNIRIWNINPYTGNFFKRIINRLRYFNYSRFLDYFINEKIGDEKFTVYLPDMSLLGKLLVTNPKCDGFKFIEEGTASYLKYDSLKTLSYFFLDSPWRARFLRIKDIPFIFRDIIFIFKGYNLKIFTLPRPANCYASFKNIQYFGFSQEVFPNSSPSDKTILSFANLKQYFSKNDKCNSLNNGYIWIGDDMATFGGLYSIGQYLNAIKESIIKEAFKNNISTIHIKFHHFDDGKFNSTILEFFKNNGFEVIVIPKSICLEIELLYLENVKIFGIDSSLLYYASLIGHKSFATYRLLNSNFQRDADNYRFYEKKVTIMGS